MNDAAMQALGSYTGGRMLLLGLGTGLGSALVIEGVLALMWLARRARPTRTTGNFELPSLRSEPPRPSRAAAGNDRLPIEEALAASRGRVYGPEGAAETLGVAPSTLESRIRRFGIDKHAFRPRVHGN